MYDTVLHRWTAQLMDPTQISPTLFGARIHNGRRRHDAPTPMLPTCACCCHGTKMQCAIVIISSVEFAANLKLSVQAIDFWIGNHAIYIKWIRVIYIYALDVDVGLAQDWIHPVSWKWCFKQFEATHQAQMRRFRMSWAPQLSWLNVCSIVDSRIKTLYNYIYIYILYTYIYII